MSQSAGPGNRTAARGPTTGSRAGARTIGTTRPIVEADGLTKVFPGPRPTLALDRVSFTIEPGEAVAVVGPSGSGKSTLLTLLGLLDRPTRGRVRLAGADPDRLAPAHLAGVRAATVGFVFQQFHLLAPLTALENVATGLLYRGVPKADRRRRAGEALAAVGLADRAGRRPRELSGGEQQRVAIARALVGRPPLILADEPTGNLDSANSDLVLRLLVDLTGDGHTLVVVTHDPAVAAALPRTLTVVDGRLAADRLAAGGRT